MIDYKGIAVIAFGLAVLSAWLTYEITSYEPKTEPLHEHVITKQFITRFKTAPVVFCKTEDKILLHDGTHSDIVLPVILFPDMEKVE